MNKFSSYLFSLLLSWALFSGSCAAQNIRCTYFFIRNSHDGYYRKDMDMQMDYFQGQSTFYSENSFVKDSLSSIAYDKQGYIKDKDAYQQLVRLPRTTRDICHADYLNGKFMLGYQEGTIAFTGTGDLTMPEWQITEEKKVFLNYSCQKAFADYLGRHWTIWFTPDIPCIAGPWLLWGAPGLIILAEDEKKEIQFRLNYLEPLHNNNRATSFLASHENSRQKRKHFKYGIKECERLHTKFMSDAAFFDEVSGSRMTGATDAKGNPIQLDWSSYMPIIPNDYWKIH